MNQSPNPAIAAKPYYMFDAINGSSNYQVTKQWREWYMDFSSGEPKCWIWAERVLGTVDQKTKDKIEKGQNNA